jgi:hypothetical protein
LNQAGHFPRPTAFKQGVLPAALEEALQLTFRNLKLFSAQNGVHRI